MTPGSRGVVLGLLLALGAWFVLQSPPDREAVDPSTIVTGDRVAPMDARHQVVPFSVLAGFEYELPGSTGGGSSASSVPPEIAGLDDQLVAVDGFMLPLDFDGAGVGTFILNASYDMCAFGAPSLVNERVEVAMSGGRRTVYTHHAIRVYGRLTIDERIEDGMAVGLYRMEAEAIGPPGLTYF